MRGRRLRPAGAIVALLGGGLLAGAAADGPAARQPLIRKATVAGQFYPAEPQRLRGAIAAYLAAAPAPLAEPPVALVVPHAGYVFSGQIAADGWRQALGRDYEVVVLLATNHRVPPFRGVSVFPGGGYETPLGLIGTDHEVVKALQAAEPLVTWRPEAHAEEHSEEVQLPFLRVVLPEARLVSAVVGSADPEVAARFGRALAKVLAGRRALIVASSDLSHYPSQADAAAVDRRTLAAIASLDTAAVGRALRAAGERPGLATCACGEGPVLAALTAARALGASRGVVLGYANSGDTVAGEPERVVGYGAVALTRGVPGADTRALEPPPVGQTTAPLGEVERAELLALARTTLEQLYATDTLPLPRPASPLLRRPQGAFVTLRRGGELRGCVGQLTSEAPLALTVARMAVGAARNDRRFLPVAAAELPELAIEISVLTPPARVRSPAAIQPGRDGVLLEQSGRQAVFLPQVATEQGWGRDELLSQLCLKAGLAPGCWRQGARLSTFQADVFGTAQDRP